MMPLLQGYLKVKKCDDESIRFDIWQTDRRTDRQSVKQNRALHA